MKQLTTVLLASAASAFLAVFVYQKVHTPDQIVIRETLPVSYINDFPAELPTATSPATLTNISEKDFVKAANMARSAVVSIRARSAGSYWRGDSYNSSSGSGVIISSEGYIATNEHVIAEGEEIIVTLDDSREFTAEVVGSDASTDLALLKVETDNLPKIEFGNSDNLDVGEWVLAIGNPFRLRSTVTAGIVSAKGRNIAILPNGIESFIQTDAAVNPGNSGGALVNSDGKLVGINTAIITFSGQYEGFSFAIPSNLARKILRDLRVYGSVQRGWLGVRIRSVDDRLAKSLDLESVTGVYIDNVNSPSAAQQAGLRSGDVIISVDGNDMPGTPDFMEYVGQKAPGDKLEVEYIRNGTKRIALVELSSRHDAAPLEQSQRDEPEQDPEELLSDLGLEVRELTNTERSRMSTSGVLVEKIARGSTIDRVNMKKDYIITSVNGTQVEDLDDFLNALTLAGDMVILDGFYEKYPGEFPYAFRKE